MEVYQSSRTAAEMEYALGAVPSIGANNHWFIGDVDTGVSAEGLTPYVGENGNWWVGETDTGVYAGGVKVEGAEVGQTIVVKAADENGIPTEWEAKTIHPSYADPFGWKKINEASLSIDDQVNQVVFTTDAEGGEFAYDELMILGANVYSTANSAMSVWANRDASYSSSFAYLTSAFGTGTQNYDKTSFIYARVMRSWPGEGGTTVLLPFLCCDLHVKNGMTRTQMMVVNDEKYIGSEEDYGKSDNPKLRKLYKIGFKASNTSVYINGKFTLYGRNYT